VCATCATRPFALASGQDLKVERRGSSETILPMGMIKATDAQLHPIVRANSPSTSPAEQTCSTGRAIVLLAKRAVHGALFMLVVLGTGCGAVSVDHASGLPSEVPLPARSAFAKQTQPGCSTCTGQSWYFTVTSTVPQQVASFYLEQLPKRGWQEVACQLYSPEHAHCLASDNHGLLTIMGVSQPLFDIAPPRGGVVLAITLIAT
jgi:hypothetical protein